MYILQYFYNSQLVIELDYGIEPLLNVYGISSIIHNINFKIYWTNIMYMKKVYTTQVMFENYMF